MLRLALPLGAAFGFMGVAAGAFGAHSLKSLLTPDLLQVFEVGVRYLMYHALALVAVGLLGRQAPQRPLEVATGAFVGGIMLFSGSLFLLAFSGARWIGALTPIGGAAFLIGWASLLKAAWSELRRC